jgi:hypothetical protein
MKRRVMMAGAAAVAGLLLPLAAAATPAAAGTGVGCTGSNCTVSVWQFVHLSGSVSQGVTRSNPINVPPPPCLWNPIGDAVTGSQYIITQFGEAQPGSLFDVYQSVQQAKKLLKNPVPGTWYILPVNPAAGPGGAAECAKLPLFAWVIPGGTPPMPNVPAVDLAEYAFNHMVVPQPTLITSPAAKGWVNLATYVWTNTPRQVSATATLGNESVTVTARPTVTTISANPGSAGTPSDNCGLRGSAARPIGTAPSTGAGKAPDCGVLWLAPATSASITARVKWVVTWGGGHLLPAIREAGTSQPFPVAEVQSINNPTG